MDIGKIYKISGYGLNYYGSTTESIKRRLARHKGHYKDFKDGKRTDKITVFDIFDKGDDYTIELIEHFICPDKKTLLDKENYYITNNECVNKCVPNRTPEQLKERQKKYNENHKEQIKETAKKWAEKDRREKGCKIKSEMVLTKEVGYSSRKARERRENETQEQKDIRLAKRREAYKNKNLAEKQREYLNNPEIKEKRRLQQIERRNKENKYI
jgi:hypothetical protein